MSVPSTALLALPSGPFRCIVADPPWPFKGTGTMKGAHHKRGGFKIVAPYQTMTHAEIEAMPVGDMATEDCHLWLWTDNADLHHGFHVMQAWGFKYLAPVHWIKPTGYGCWWIHRTQTILFGYRSKCRFPLARFRPNLIHAGVPKRHSEKPEEAFALIESVSPGPRLELFARRARPGWTTIGNEADGMDVKDSLILLAQGKHPCYGVEKHGESRHEKDV